MATLSVHLFGRFEVCCDDRRVDALNSSRARELLGYLVLHRNRPQQREILAELLWGESTPRQARKYLRQALWHLQAALRLLGRDLAARTLNVDSEWVQLNCRPLRVDLVQFEEATHACDRVRGAALDDTRIRRLEHAVRLYRGDLLEGWYCDWCLVERERLQTQLLDALEKLSGFYEAQRDSEKGLFYARQVLAVDPAREHVHRQIMQLHLCAGHRTEALKQYRVCERVLLRELSVKPSTDTRLVYESIRDDRLDDLADTALAPAPLACNVNQLAGLLDALERVKATLANIEKRLRFAAASMSSTDDRCANTLERGASADAPETRLRRPAGTS